MKRFLKWALAVIVTLGVLFFGLVYFDQSLSEQCVRGEAQSRVDACTTYINYFSWADGIDEAYHNRGMAYKEMGETDKAIADLRTSAGMNQPGSSVSREVLQGLGAAP
jgi:hypothetical protein